MTRLPNDLRREYNSDTQLPWQVYTQTETLYSIQEGIVLGKPELIWRNVYRYWSSND